MNVEPGSPCIACRLPKANRECGICAEPLCRQCAIFLDAETFSFLPELPDELRHTFYCPNCHQEHVEPALADYEETLERARQAYFFSDASRRRLIPILKEAELPVVIESCADRKELILKLAFLAVKQGFNAVVEAQVKCEKVRNEGYQKSRWSGQGIPAQVDAQRLEKIDRQENGEWE